MKIRNNLPDSTGHGTRYLPGTEEEKRKVVWSPLSRTNVVSDVQQIPDNDYSNTATADFGPNIMPRIFCNRDISGIASSSTGKS